MTPHNPFPDPEPGLDAVVRAQLDAEAARTDGRRMANRVLARLAADPAPVRRQSWRRAAALAGVAALAAGVLIAAFVFSDLPDVPGTREVAASPVDVVQAARVAYTPNDARCYRVTLELPARVREALPHLDPAPRTLCTRGDRFVLEPGFGGKGASGRDASGRVWLAPTPEGAVTFDEAELPPAMRHAVKIHELEPATLLDEVLVAFDLTWAEPPPQGADTYSVTATRRGDAPPLRIAAAELVIDKNTNVIRSLTLYRRALGDGSAKLTFTLLAGGGRDDAAFTPEGHIRPGAPVLDRTKPLQRRRLLTQQLGERWTNGS